VVGDPTNGSAPWSLPPDAAHGEATTSRPSRSCWTKARPTAAAAPRRSWTSAGPRRKKAGKIFQYDRRCREANHDGSQPAAIRPEDAAGNASPGSKAATSSYATSSRASCASPPPAWTTGSSPVPTARPPTTSAWWWSDTDMEVSHVIRGDDHGPTRPSRRASTTPWATKPRPSPTCP